MTTKRHPLLYQMNARVLLRQLSILLGRPASLDDIPDEAFERLAEQGFEWLYLLGAWQTGSAALRMSLSNPGLNEEYRRSLQDFTEDDVCGSCFAVTGYSVHSGLGGAGAMRRLRDRLARRGLRLMLDYVPNHTAPDHPWVQEHPEYYIQGSAADLDREPLNYTHVVVGGQQRVFAHGRDPYFPGWADTLQLDYSRAETCAAMQAELERAAAECDGLRCDMAMLLLPEVFERTWGRPARPFWSEAIDGVKSAFPGFVFMAEVYWDLEAALLELGFDYTYDKRLYDYLREGEVRAVGRHLQASPAYLGRMVHFLENHDEQRAAAVFPPAMHRAAAVVSFFAPGVRFFHQGQLEGRRVKISVHLQRGPNEPDDPDLSRFYQGLLAALNRPVFMEGSWELLQCRAANRRLPHPSLLAYKWSMAGSRQGIAVVNYAPQPAHGWAQVENPPAPGFAQLLASRQGAFVEFSSEGMEIDLPGWGYWAGEAGPA